MCSSQIAIVTGASGSIGGAIATRLQKQDYEVLATYHQNPGDVPTACESLKVDFRDPRKAVQKISDHIHSETSGELSLIIHAAGITRDNLLMNTSIEDWDQIRSIHLDAVYHLASQLGTELNDNSHFLVLTSKSGLSGRTGQSNYASAKSALIGFVRSLAQEWAPEVSVNAIRPPVTESRMTRNLSDQDREKLSKESLNKGISSTKPVVEALDYVINSNQVSGQVISSDNRIDTSW